MSVMRGYGARLMRLLGDGWTGPYDVGGRWEIVAEWLGARSTILEVYRAPSREAVLLRLGN